MCPHSVHSKYLGIQIQITRNITGAQHRVFNWAFMNQFPESVSLLHLPSYFTMKTLSMKTLKGLCHLITFLDIRNFETSTTMVAAPKNGVEFRKKSLGAIRCSLAMSYDNWRRGTISMKLTGTGRQAYLQKLTDFYEMRKIV